MSPPSGSDADSDISSADALRRRVAELEARLGEAEETLDAIRSGEVDAVVVGHAQDRRVFTLESADRPYRLLIEQMKEGAVTLGADGVILYCNQAFAELVGAPASRVIGDRFGHYVLESREPLHLLYEAGGRAEILLSAAAGERRSASLSLSPLPTESGQLMCGIVADLTESRAHARDLADARQDLAVAVAKQEGDERYRALFEAIDTGFCVIEVIFDERGKAIDYRFVEANPAFERHSGLVGAIGRRIREFAPELEEVWFERYGRVALTGESFRVEDEAAPLGRWFDINAFRTGAAEQRRVAVLVNDITERRRAEAVVRELNATLEQRVVERTAELAAANRLLQAEISERQLAQDALRQSQKMEAMGQLTGGVAHDFNNLLTPIIGSLDMLQRRGIGGEREQRLINGALQSADRAKTLVQRLLAFARRQPLKATAVDLGALLDNMGELVASTSGPQINIVVNAPKDLAPACADPNQLEMAILNLAVNARDAMPDGGTLTLSARDARVGEDHRSRLPPGPYVALSVADTGTGMDAATVKRAAEPFFSTKGVGKGTGLGLSMVHGLASQLGGAMTLMSEPGLGTKVELWLPVSARPVETGSGSGPSAPDASAAGLVLLVDDEALVRTSTADMLTELGYEVVEAASAGEALKLLEGGLKADLLLTDHLMPGMTGTDLARETRARWPDCPVLLISGFAEAEGVAPDLPRLTKPFRQAELAGMLATLS